MSNKINKLNPPEARLHESVSQPADGGGVSSVAIQRPFVGRPMLVWWCGGKPIATNHHPNCPHYNDSLIDVWRVSDGSSSYYTTDEHMAISTQEEEEACGNGPATITKERIHREVFENLPEFDGF